MKKLILSVALIASVGCYAQQQNTNWFFGQNTGLKFSPDPLNPTPITTSLTSLEGCAAYTNQSGEFIFYTNGIQAFNVNGTNADTQMTEGFGLMGHTSSTNSALIIPQPLQNSDISPGAIAVVDPENVYLVTIDGYSGGSKGLYYSVVNLLNNNTAQIVATRKNIILQDHLGNNIDGNYMNNGQANMSEKITSVPHCNGMDYWLVAQIGDRINSYLVTRSGITLQPQNSSVAPVNVQMGGAGGGQIKISPNTKRIAVCYQNVPNQMYGALALGNFDNFTGEVTFDENLIFIEPPVPTDPEVPQIRSDVYGAEFSSNNNFVYFGIGAHLYRANANGDTSAQIQQISTIPYEFRQGIQRSYSGRIYVSNVDINDNFLISVINSPNSAVNCELQENVFPTLTGARCSFPQWIHWQTGNCPTNHALISPDLHTLPFKYQASDFITTGANYRVSENQNIRMTAANFILMRENTDIRPGSVFSAEIKLCGGCN